MVDEDFIKGLSNSKEISGIFEFDATNDLTSMDFENKKFSNVHIKDANLLSAIFRDCEFYETVFETCILAGVNFDKCKFIKCTFTKCDISFSLNDCNVSTLIVQN